MINRQIPPYKELAMARAYTGPDKFHFFGQYCSGPFKAAWENELTQIFAQMPCVQTQRSIARWSEPGFVL